MKTVTIHANLDGNSAKIVNEDGVVLEGVRSVVIEMEAGNFNTAEIVLRGVGANIQAAVKEVQFECPLCQELTEHSCSE